MKLRHTSTETKASTGRVTFDSSCAFNVFRIKFLKLFCFCRNNMNILLFQRLVHVIDQNLCFQRFTRAFVLVFHNVQFEISAVSFHLHANYR
jgi:hypothetical protein